MASGLWQRNKDWNLAEMKTKDNKIVQNCACIWMNVIFFPCCKEKILIGNKLGNEAISGDDVAVMVHRTPHFSLVRCTSFLFCWPNVEYRESHTHYYKYSVMKGVELMRASLIIQFSLLARGFICDRAHAYNQPGPGKGSEWDVEISRTTRE